MGMKEYYFITAYHLFIFMLTITSWIIPCLRACLRAGIS
jgi:hypothetical protein